MWTKKSKHKTDKTKLRAQQVNIFSGTLNTKYRLCAYKHIFYFHDFVCKILYIFKGKIWNIKSDVTTLKIYENIGVFMIIILGNQLFQIRVHCPDNYTQNEEQDLTKYCGTLRADTLRPAQNGCHFADDICKCIFVMEDQTWMLNWMQI